MSKEPPKTKRYCTICKKMTKYKYDPMIGHSFCLGCGASSLFSKAKKPK